MIRIPAAKFSPSLPSTLHGSIRRVRGALAAFLLLFLTGCFDYQERIVFAPDFSGYVDYEYVVPVHPKSGSSMIAFLPVEESRIVSRYSGFFSGRKVEIENYKMEYMEDPKEKEAFSREAKVSFRIHFHSPEELEFLLLGKTTVFWRDGRLHIQRMFPTAKPIPDDSGFVTRRLDNLTTQSFKGKRLRFSVVFPWFYDLFTNQGSIIQPGVQVFTVPLENTLHSGTSIFWNLEIKANPAPKDAS